MFTYTPSDRAAPLPPFLISFSELSAARALLVHLLHLSHGNPRHPLHQDGPQNQADFGDPAKSALEAATTPQRAHHAADGAAAAAAAAGTDYR